MLVRCDYGENEADRLTIMRQHRDRFLAASDWTQMPDIPLSDEQRTEWATYRQALRDAPANWVPAETWDAPDPPEVN